MRNTRDNTIIFGRNAVYELLRSDATVEKIFIQSGLKGDVITDIIELAKEHAVHFQMVPAEKLNRITRANHQGVVAIRSLIQYFELEDVMMHAYDKGESPLFVLCDGVTDVRNFGAIARSAECFGVHAIVHPLENAAQINGVAVQASAGALNHIHVSRVAQAMDAVRFFKLNGIKVYCASEDAEVTIKDVDFTAPCAIVMGAEDEGISQKILRVADETFKIPMTGMTGSFNVSVAAGIILYEAYSQRTK